MDGHAEQRPDGEGEEQHECRGERREHGREPQEVARGVRGVPAGRSAKSATGLADAGSVWQKPAAAVEANAAATGLTPAASAAATTRGTSTDDLAERDWSARWAAVLITITPARNIHGGIDAPPGTHATSQSAAPDSASAMPIAMVAAMKRSSGQGTVRRPSLRRTVPSAGEEATTAPMRATTAGDTPWSGSLHHSSTTVPSRRRHRASDGLSGPSTGASECSWICAAVIRTGPLRSARRVVVNRTSSAARWEETTASGSPRISQVTKPSSSPSAPTARRR